MHLNYLDVIAAEHVAEGLEPAELDEFEYLGGAPTRGEVGDSPGGLLFRFEVADFQDFN